MKSSSEIILSVSWSLCLLRNIFITINHRLDRSSSLFISHSIQENNNICIRVPAQLPDLHLGDPVGSGGGRRQGAPRQTGKLGLTPGSSFSGVTIHKTDELSQERLQEPDRPDMLYRPNQPNQHSSQLVLLRSAVACSTSNSSGETFSHAALRAGDVALGCAQMLVGNPLTAAIISCSKHLCTE